jgi:hypothetical protein
MGNTLMAKKTYRQPSPQSREKLLWDVHDDFMAWLRDAEQNTVTDHNKLDRIMLGLASLAKALAGGYRDHGVRS